MARSMNRESTWLARRLAIAALLTIGTFVASAGAADHRYDHRGWDHQGGGYHGAPPVVYGGPVYAPPPVVYGPTIGINLPGVSIGIQ
jgi:hypothetical protein